MFCTAVNHNQHQILWLCAYILALVIRHANHILSVPHSILICGLSDATISFHTILLTAQFLQKKLLDIKCVLNFSTNFERHISHSKQN